MAQLPALPHVYVQVAVGNKAPLGTAAIKTLTDAVAAGNNQNAQLMIQLVEMQGRQAAERAEQSARLRRELMVQMGEMQVQLAQTLVQALAQPSPPQQQPAYMGTGMPPFPGLSPYTPATLFQPPRM